jgi:hypothetical protein
MISLSCGMVDGYHLAEHIYLKGGKKMRDQSGACPWK